MPSAATRALEAKLAALSGPQWDSSDDEATGPDSGVKQRKKGIAMKKVNKNKPGSKVYEKEEDTSEATNVIYVGHLPENFEEAELRGFLGQFGQVKRIKLSRSKKTANPRGYAFVEFDDPEVAAIVAETMSGYLMGQKRLVCHVLPKEKLHPSMFKGANRVFTKINWAGRHRDQVNKAKTSQKMKEITKKLVSRERKKRNKLKELGIDFDFPGYEAAKKAISGEDTKMETKTDSPKRKMSEASEASSNSKTDKKKRRKMSSDEMETSTPPAKLLKKAASEKKMQTSATPATTSITKASSEKKLSKAVTPPAKSIEKASSEKQTHASKTPTPKSNQKAASEKKTPASKTPTAKSNQKVASEKKTPAPKEQTTKSIEKAASEKKTPEAKSIPKASSEKTKTPPAKSMQKASSEKKIAASETPPARSMQKASSEKKIVASKTPPAKSMQKASSEKKIAASKTPASKSVEKASSEKIIAPSKTPAAKSVEKASSERKMSAAGKKRKNSRKSL